MGRNIIRRETVDTSAERTLQDIYLAVMEGGSAADQCERIYALLVQFGYRID